MASSAVMAIVAAAVLATVAADSGLVDAPAGPIQGVVTPWAREFRGVPFAKSPVGSLRWALPQRAAPWTQTLDASQDGPGCPQQCVLPKRGCPPTTSEDCLLLNIFTPLPDSDIAVEDAQDGGSPVMVFIHGGNMRQGYAGGPLYDGTHLANTTGVVVVVIQYRLGMLGWLTTNTTMPPNLGLRDQLMALAWVQDNIAAFGGDPSKVTVFGQSAGAVSIAALLGAPASKGLFRAAIMERCVVQSPALHEPLLTPCRCRVAAASVNRLASRTAPQSNHRSGHTMWARVTRDAPAASPSTIAFASSRRTTSSRRRLRP